MTHKKKPQTPDTKPYGEALAEQVAATLNRGRSLGDVHREACCMGFNYHRGEFRYGAVSEQGLSPIRTFNREQFEEWLADQSDATMALPDAKPEYWVNEAITRAELMKFVQG